MSLSPAAARSVDVSEAGEGGYGLDTDSGNRPNRLPIGSIKVVAQVYRETGAHTGRAAEWQCRARSLSAAGGTVYRGQSTRRARPRDDR